MQTNVIDAVEFNISSIESENLYEVARDVGLTGHYFWLGVISCNKAKFDSLPAEVQTALVEASALGAVLIPAMATEGYDRAYASAQVAELMLVTFIPDLGYSKADIHKMISANASQVIGLD